MQGLALAYSSHENGNTPLHFATAYGQIEIVKFLLKKANEKGIEIAKKNTAQRTPEDYARILGHKDILNLFFKNPFDYLFSELRRFLSNLSG